MQGTSTNGSGVFGTITGDTAGQSALLGEDTTTGAGSATNGGYGVRGTSVNGIGAAGIVTSATGSYGVWGRSNANHGVYGSTAANGFSGVAGQDDTSNATSSGVYGESQNGTGVYGTATNGTGVYATSSTGKALSVQGVAFFSRSGLAQVKANKSAVTVTGVILTTSSMILATPQGHQPGVGVAGVISDPGASSFKICLTEAATDALDVAWFVIG